MGDASNCLEAFKDKTDNNYGGWGTLKGVLSTGQTFHLIS